MDVIVVLSDRKLTPADARDVERLEDMTRTDGLVALAACINPDARVMSAEPLHPAFTTFLSSRGVRPLEADGVRRETCRGPLLHGGHAKRIPAAVELRRHVLSAGRAGSRRENGAEEVELPVP